MNEYRTKMTENGRVIIPAKCRKLMKLKPGTELIIRFEDDELRLVSQQRALAKARSLVKKHAKNIDLVEELKKFRTEDKKNEKTRHT